ncbi:TIGR03766 family XrtG-associated glycosyltransferase [Lactobacillus sp. HBUAS51381]|uniref:TIGR03766 family XrtG-associated glycosyltransferase n=1 Tax=Lactobacillus sp. HBUAS51381 TaxID=2722743 RepID=UPI0014564661|nr:TIGR03766 family XrtG-associated glycosyltransferase [Lactobacillus sp. HBUAS51381]NLR10331.1 hypothetical protein [Lactobacillus sp. HBUAS51381]
MREKLYKFNSRAIKLFFYFLFTLAFIFALTSPNLILGDNHINGIGTTMVVTVVLIIAFGLGLSLYISPQLQRLFHYIFIKQRWRTATWCLVITFCLQGCFIYLVHPGIGFDVGAIHYALTNPTDLNEVGYFSVNPNNINLLLLQHWLAVQFHHTSWIFFDIITTILVDLSALLNLLSIAAIDKSKVPLTMYIQTVWLLLFPSILVPYTDTWVLPCISAYILCYCVIAFSTAPKLLKGIMALLFGVCVISAYFVKPSGVIPAIAIIIIEAIHLLKPHHRQWWWIVLVGLFMISSTAASYQFMSKTVSNQSYIRINSFRAKPMIHFINMGMSGDGGFNAHDSYIMAITVNKKQRIKYSENSIKRRLHKMGPSGYLAFLYQKQKHNTADGSFGWIKEGNFLNGSPIPSTKGIRGTIEEFLYLYGNNLGDFRFLAQAWWVFLLGLILFAWRDNRKIIQVLRLAILGGFLFLLAFEGGRTRYLIQFLPVLLLLASLGFDATRQEFKHWFGWMGAASRSQNSTKSTTESPNN